MIADLSWTYVILLRWIHVICAGLLIGGTFFLAFLLPRGASAADEPTPEDAPYLRSRRAFKIVTHVCFLFLLLSGAYNAYGNWHIYNQNPALSHGLFGPHALFGVLSLVLLVVLFARKQPRPAEQTWLGATVILLFLTVLIASSLKYVRDHAHAQSSTTTQPARAGE